MGFENTVEGFQKRAKARKVEKREEAKLRKRLREIEKREATKARLEAAPVIARERVKAQTQARIKTIRQTAGRGRGSGINRILSNVATNVQRQGGVLGSSGGNILGGGLGLGGAGTGRSVIGPGPAAPRKKSKPLKAGSGFDMTPTLTGRGFL